MGRLGWRVAPDPESPTSRKEVVYRIRCALLATFSVRTRPIADDDLHAGMLAQPIGEYLCRSFVHQVNRAMRLEVQQESAISANTTPTA